MWWSFDSYKQKQGHLDTINGILCDSWVILEQHGGILADFLSVTPPLRLQRLIQHSSLLWANESLM